LRGEKKGKIKEKGEKPNFQKLCRRMMKERGLIVVTNLNINFQKFVKG
jgi:hypothetical protein